MRIVTTRDRVVRLIGSLAVAATLSLSLGGQGTKPERKVVNNVVESARDPRVEIALPESAHYVGGDRWILYGIADCELHAFVDADSSATVQRLYWVQFEQYVPSRPELHHTYDSPSRRVIAGMDFYVDTWVRGKDSTTTPGSDLEHLLALLRAKGYRMPPETMSVRLVHLLDDQKRKELMIIYSEDLASTRLSAEQLRKDSMRDQWTAIETGLIERAVARVKLTPVTR